MPRSKYGTKFPRRDGRRIQAFFLPSVPPFEIPLPSLSPMCDWSECLNLLAAAPLLHGFRQSHPGAIFVAPLIFQGRAEFEWLRPSCAAPSVLTVALFLIIDAWKIWLLSAPPPRSKETSAPFGICLTFLPQTDPAARSIVESEIYS